MAAGFEERVLGQGAGGDEADDVAFDDGFIAALLGLGGVFQLFGDGDAEAFPDQGEEVAFGRMDRDAAHGDGLTLVEAAFGEGDVEGGAGGDGVVEEHLVEVTHPVEKKGAGVLGLDVQILRHHRRDGVFGHCWSPGGGGRLQGRERSGKGGAHCGEISGHCNFNGLGPGVYRMSGFMSRAPGGWPTSSLQERWATEYRAFPGHAGHLRRSLRWAGIRTRSALVVSVVFQCCHQRLAETRGGQGQAQSAVTDCAAMVAKII